MPPTPVMRVYSLQGDLRHDREEQQQTWLQNVNTLLLGVRRAEEYRKPPYFPLHFTLNVKLLLKKNKIIKSFKKPLLNTGDLDL